MRMRIQQPGCYSLISVSTLSFVYQILKSLMTTATYILLCFLDAGKSFGELALINPDCIRNASIISEETTDLLVVNRDLYNRSLHSFQAREFEERKRFVEEFPLFSNWQPRYKKQVAMSLRKEKISFEGNIVKQGQAINGVLFLLRYEQL